MKTILIIFIAMLLFGCSHDDFTTLTKSDKPVKVDEIWLMKFNDADNPFETDSTFILILRNKGTWSEFWFWDNKNKRLFPPEVDDLNHPYEQRPDSEIRERFNYFDTRIK